MYGMVILLALLAGHQGIVESFADGELHRNPSWTGDTLWRVEPWGQDYALRSHGLPQPDTLILATASETAYGTWQILFATASVNLSTANGVRIYLIADTSDLRRDVYGYYLQLGTNNLDRVELWRQDGFQRTRLATGPSYWFTRTTDTLKLTIQRDPQGTWEIRAHGTRLLHVRDNRYQESTYFGLWVRHSSTTGSGYIFDDIIITPGLVSLDENPPYPQEVIPLDTYTLRVVFNEAVAGCLQTGYQVLPTIGFPSTVTPCDQSFAQTYTLTFSRPFQRNTLYTLYVRNIADTTGNVSPLSTWTFTFAIPGTRDLVINEVHVAPSDPLAEFIEIYNRTADTLDIQHLYLRDASGTTGKLRHLPRKLPPQDFLILVRDSTAFHNAFPTNVTFFEVTPWPVLNNRADTVSLLWEDRLLDRMHYHRTGQADHQSLERRDPHAASHAATNWAPSLTPEGATPGRMNSQFMPDRRPPLLSDLIVKDSLHLELFFNEPLDSTQTLSPSSLYLSPPLPIQQVAIPDTLDYTLQVYLQTPLHVSTFYTIRFRDVRDYAGNIASGDTTFLGGPGEAVRPGDIIINELFIAPPDPTLEFIELYNRSDRILNLQHLTITDSLGTPVPLVKHPRFLLPDGYLVLAADPVLLQQTFAMPQSALPLDRWPTLNNQGDVITLWTGDTPIDRVAYRANWGNPGVSLERVDPDGPSSYAWNWKPSCAPSGGTPGYQNSCYAPDRRPPEPLSAEQRLPDTIYVFFDEPLAPATYTPEHFNIDDTYPQKVIPDSPNMLKLVFSDRLSSQTLFLSDIQDLSGNVLVHDTLRIAFAPRPGMLQLNEILYEPEAHQPEYVELRNTSDTLLTLRWSRLIVGYEDSFYLPPVLLQPHGFAVLFATPGGDSTLLARAFPSMPEEALRLPVSRSTLGLRNDGDHLAFYSDNVQTDSLTYQPAWHHPDLVYTRGISLERSFSGTWTSSVDPEGGTPGRANTLSVPPSPESRTSTLTVEPSPFSPDNDGIDDETVITYHLGMSIARIQIRIFDINGREVRRLIPAALTGYQGRIRWNGRAEDHRLLPTGIYIVFLEAIDTSTGRRTRRKKPVVLVR